MSEPIFGHLEHAWRTAEGDISRLFHHARYHDATTSATVPKGTTMSLAQVEQDIREQILLAESKAAEVYNHAKTILEQHLPQLAELAQKASTNPLVDAAMAAAHLSPELLAGFAKAVNEADAALSALPGAQAADAPDTGEAAPAAGAAPAEPVAQPA